MDELEQKLTALHLAAPSAELDRRMDEVFLVAGRARKESVNARLWWWLAAATATGGIAALLIVSLRPAHPAPPALVYHVEAQGRMREMLLGRTAIRDGLPSFDFRVDSP